MYNPSLDTHGETGRFLQLRHASGTLYDLILHVDLVFVPQHSNLFSKLILCHRFSKTNFAVSVFSLFCFVYCWFLLCLGTPSRVDKCALQVLLSLLLLLLLLLIYNCFSPPRGKCVPVRAEMVTDWLSALYNWRHRLYTPPGAEG